MADSQASSKWLVILSLAIIYIVWGSTYLGIAIALEGLPPFLMTAGRFVLSGVLLLGWAAWRGESLPRRVHWRSALIIGALMMFGGTGGVTWAEQHVPSGFAALMIAAVPIWAVVLDWSVFGGQRPNRRMTVGLAMGLVGVALLIGPAEILGGGEGFDTLGVLALLIAALSWSAGSLYSRQASLPGSHVQASGMEMLSGGLVLMLAGTAAGEWSQLDLAAVSTRAWIAYFYLLTVGGAVVFSAYLWLLRNTTPARATSYAYVNPIIAVILGWAVADEVLTVRMIVAAVIIVSSVALIISARAQASGRPQPRADDSGASQSSDARLEREPSTAR